MEAPGDSGWRDARQWARVLKGFERIVILVMMGLLMVVVAVSTGELGWLILRDLSTFRGMVLDTEEMFGVFGFFLLVLIGVELLATLKVYIREGAVHMEVVLEVALIAVAQKIIVLDTGRSSGLLLLGLAALVLALAAAYRWVRGART
jgi:uncharacterized membrane protein (DUF373 family)